MPIEKNICPLLINTSDTGGSATATKRIHHALRSIGVDSQMLVQEKSTSEGTIQGPESKAATAWSLVRPHVDMLPLRLYGKSSEFAVNWLPERMTEQIDQIDPDVVHLNWMGRGTMSIKSIGSIDRPVVWRLPDMHAITGGCYYAYGCDQFENKCGSCPKLDSEFPFDLSRINWHRKQHYWRGLDLTIVTPSTWLAKQARRSSLFGDYRIEVIPNTLNTAVYKPRNERLGRELFGLPADKSLVLFGAVDPIGDYRKGADLLQEALQELSTAVNDVELVVFGSDRPENPPEFGFPTHYVGYLYDDPSLALLYNAADVMVVPSRYEGFGQTVSEALACGTPVVAFDATGPSDIVDHRKTGWLAEAYSIDDLQTGIKWVINNSEKCELSKAARKKAINEYQYKNVARKYMSLYEEILPDN